MSLSSSGCWGLDGSGKDALGAASTPASFFLPNNVLPNMFDDRRARRRRGCGNRVCLAVRRRERVWSFYISYRGFYPPTRPPGAPRRPGSPSQATFVGEDRTWPPCPRSGRGAPRTLAHRAPWGARKRRRSRSANDMRPDPMACSTAEERPRTGTGPAQRQPCGPGGHVPHRHRTLQQGVRSRPPKCDSHVPATLVPDGAAPRTQESHPSTLGGLGALNERFDSRVPLDATPPGWPPTYERPEHGHHARAERAGRDWVGLSST